MAYLYPQRETLNPFSVRSLSMGIDPALGNEDYCYLTTTGRATGRPREIEIWFGLQGPVLYMLAGAGRRANWVRNILRDPAVSVRIAERTFGGRGRLVGEAAEDALARRLLFDKYSRGGENLAGWRDTALPVAVDLALD